jgi:hypothetical protein
MPNILKSNSCYILSNVTIIVIHRVEFCTPLFSEYY